MAAMYADPQDLPAWAPTGLDAGVVTAALMTASAVADGYLAGQFQLPITVWGADLRDAVANIAGYDLLANHRGFNPDAPGNESIRAARKDATAWLEGVAANAIHPQGITDNTPAEDGFGPMAAYGRTSDDGEFVVSNSAKPRGWR